MRAVMEPAAQQADTDATPGPGPGSAAADASHGHAHGYRGHSAGPMQGDAAAAVPTRPADPKAALKSLMDSIPTSREQVCAEGLHAVLAVQTLVGNL